MGRVRTKRPVVLPGWLTAATAAIADAPDDTALEAALATFGPPYGFERAEERSLYSWVDVLNRLDDVLERYALASPTVVATLTRPLGREAAGGAGAAGDPPSAGASPPGEGGGAWGGPRGGVPAGDALGGGARIACAAGWGRRRAHRRYAGRRQCTPRCCRRRDGPWQRRCGPACGGRGWHRRERGRVIASPPPPFPLSGRPVGPVGRPGACRLPSARASRHVRHQECVQ